MTERSVDSKRLIDRLNELGSIGRNENGALSRIALSEQDKEARDQLVRWLTEAGLEVAVDRIGNIFGIWDPANALAVAGPVMVGSHIDTVINAGTLDGCYGVLAGLAVIEALRAAAIKPLLPIVVGAFTNEEGVRYAPDMMGSLVYAGRLELERALETRGTDGSVLGEELSRIGYAGEHEPGFIRPSAYLELHVEQGPILEREGIAVGAVENLQGISWQRVTVTGDANHAGTTPISMRKDAGLAAARVISFLRDRASTSPTQTVATVGCIAFEPNAINVIPSKAVFTVDLRDPNEARLVEEEEALQAFLEKLAREDGVRIDSEPLARFEPVRFDESLVVAIETAALGRGWISRRMTSGAGHDAQMMARIAPSAMIFVPSAGGISHNPREHTPIPDLIQGANVLLDVVTNLVCARKEQVNDDR